MSRFPEWFVGGPWHGKDKLEACPNLQGSVMVAVPEPLDYNPRMITMIPTMEDMRINRVVYVPKRFSFFGEILTAWVMDDHDFISDHETGRLLGELIMAPHKIKTDTGYNRIMAEAASPHLERWQIEREIRGELNSEYRQQISTLEGRLAEFQRLARLTDHGEGIWLYQDVTDGRNAGRLEIATESEWVSVQFDRVTCYLDQGTDEDGPSWVATAQAVRGPDGPVTGYGTTPKAAILAMLADAIDVYARMVDTSEKPRIK